MSSDWSYNLRTGAALSDDECSDTHNESPRHPLSQEAEFLRQIDISSRQDEALYKPNPWSIAKVNAASRPKPSNPQKPANYPVHEKASPKGAIIDAFKKHAEKPHQRLTQSNASRAIVPPRSQPTITKGSTAPVACLSSRFPARLPVTTNTASQVALPTHLPGSGSSSSLCHGRVPMLRLADEENAHIVTDINPSQCLSSMASSGFISSLQNALPVEPSSAFNVCHINAPSVEFSPSSAALSPTSKYTDSNCQPVLTDHGSPHTYFAHQPPLNERHLFSSYPTMQAFEVPVNSIGPPRQTASARASIDRLFGRRSQIPGRQVLSSPPAPSFYSSYQPHTYRQTRSSPEPARQDESCSAQMRHIIASPQSNLLNPVFAPARISPRIDHPYSSRKRKVPYISPRSSPSRPRPLSPLHPPNPRVKANPLPIKRENDCDQKISFSPDSEWSTLRRHQKRSARTGTGVKTTGKFRLPLNFGGRTMEPTVAGNVAGNKVRVVTYLPPPKKTKIDAMNTVAAAYAKKPIASDLVNFAGDDAEQQQSHEYSDNRQRATVGLISPPPSDDLPVASIQTPAVVFDVDGVVQRYKMVRHGLRMRKQTSNQLWDVLGLQSCGVVYRDPHPEAPQSREAPEIAIVSWPSDAIDLRKCI